MTPQEATNWADKIDAQLSLISDADADRLAIFLRRVARNLELSLEAKERFQIDRRDHDLAIQDAIRETAELADLCAFWRYQAIWQRAVRLQHDLMSTPLENIEDTPQWKEAERKLEEARHAENRERHSHAETPRDPGGT